MLNKKKSTLLTYAGIAVLFLFSLCYSQMEVSLSGLEASRFAVAEAVGEQGVFHITFTQFRTADRIVRDGKVYSDKPLVNGNEDDLVPVRSIVTKNSGNLSVITPDLINRRFAQDFTDQAAIGLSFATSLTEGMKSAVYISNSIDNK